MGVIDLPSHGSIYLDAAPLIYSVERIEPYWSLMQPVWDGAAAGRFALVSSELSLLEVLVGPRKSGNVALETLYRQLLLGTRELQLVPISQAILDRATSLRGNFGLKTPDAIHIATALESRCTVLVTNDKQFGQVLDVPMTILSNLITS